MILALRLSDPPMTSNITVRVPVATDAETAIEGLIRRPAAAPKSTPESNPGVRKLSYDTRGDM